MNKTILLVAALAVAGCKKSDGGAGEGGSAATDDKACTAAIGKAVDTMIEGRRKMIAEQRAKSGQPPQEPDMTQMNEVSTKLRGTLITRCTEDKWPASVVSCFTSASDFTMIKKCEEGLTPEQNRKRQQEVMKVMMGGRMGGMGGGPPHGGAGAQMPPTVEPPATGSGSAAPAGSGSAAPAATGSGSAAPAAGSAH